MAALLSILGVLVGAIALYAWLTDRRNVRRTNTPPEMEPQHALRLDAHARDQLTASVAPEEEPC